MYVSSKDITLSQYFKTIFNETRISFDGNTTKTAVSCLNLPACQNGAGNCERVYSTFRSYSQTRWTKTALTFLCALGSATIDFFIAAFLRRWSELNRLRYFGDVSQKFCCCLSKSSASLSKADRISLSLWLFRFFLSWFIRLTSSFVFSLFLLPMATRKKESTLQIQSSEASRSLSCTQTSGMRKWVHFLEAARQFLA